MRLKVRYVCTIYCNDGGHVTRIVFVTFKSMFLSISFGYNCFSYFDSYCFSYFDSVNNEEKLRIRIFNIFE